MIKIFFTVVLLYINTYALSLSSDDKYKLFQGEKYSITFTSDYENEAIYIKKNIDDFLEHNDRSFGYSFDDKIKIVLISNNIQVPNAFSTQVPYNLGVYFNGGSGMNEYFSNSSWLTTLLTHEMIHNYQTNAKKSEISKTLHKYLGNNYMPVFAVAPFFTLPNLLLPTAILEGDAVLNESLYNNGGRLFNGSLNAMKNSLVFNNKITPSRFINDHLEFPYTTEKYIVGGFYMQYMANKYGVDKVNQFFYENSIHSINPFLLNSSYENHFGIEFEQSIRDFVNFTKDKYKGYKELKNKNILARSKSEVYFSKIENNIYYITTDLIEEKRLNIYDLNTNSIRYNNTSLPNGKVYKKSNKLYSSSSDFISSKHYKHGLFDENNYILDTTIGKDIKDIYKDKIAYVNIKESFLKSKLYINDAFYSNISSNALFNKSGDIYYFVQEDDKRVLFKNKTRLYSFKSYFSKIVDIVDDEIYFIANTKYGSTLYKYSLNQLYRLDNNDNIVNAKIIDQNNAIVATITQNQYEIQKITLTINKIDNIPTQEILTQKKNFDFKSPTNQNKLSTKNYNELKELKFSMLYPSYSYDSENGSSYFLNALFIDPIMFNMVNLYTFKDSEDKITGISYTNERYIPFSFDIYDIKRETPYSDERKYGGSFELYGPLIKKGRNVLDLSIKQIFDDENKDKNPTIISVNHNYKKSFPLGDFYYLNSDTKALIKKDRGDIIGGVDYRFQKHILNELYFDIELRGLYSNIDSLDSQRGIEVVTQTTDNKDATNTIIQGCDNDFFVKELTKINFGLSKTFHFSSYFSKFPISLRKESIFYTYNQFDVKQNSSIKIKENIIGTKLDVLFFHKLAIPITIKYIENDTSADDYKMIFSLGISF